jgi:hypothetical protein
MKIEEAEIILRELTDYLSHDRIGKINSVICQNNAPSLAGFSLSKASILCFAVNLTCLKRLL